jgi:two-component system, OmpR family, phosphate regulon sensor histidine kinase PhoR
MNLRNNLFILASAAYVGFGIGLILVFHASLILLLCILALFIGGAVWGLRMYLLAPLREFQNTLRSIAEGNTSLRVDLNRAKALRPVGELVNMVAESMNSDLVRMRKLERMRSEFLGNVSHELRTPIFSIQGMLETLLGGAVDDPSVNREFIGRALANTERLNRLLEDLIDISRVESGELKLKFRFFDIVPLIDETVNELQSKAAPHHVTLQWKASAPRLEVYGDKERIRQVLINLIDNALKYSGEGTVVTVSATGAQRSVEMAVADTGVGIAAEHLPRIFERFYRIDKDRSRDVGGTGLGLAIAKHIIEAHRSTISVVSALGKGTTFRFSLSTPYILHGTESHEP